MRIGLLADRLDRDRTTGLGNYMEGLRRGLGEIGDEGDEFVLLANDGPRLRRLRSAALGRPRTTAGRDLDLVHVLVPGFPVAVDVPLVVTIHDLFPLKLPRHSPAHSRWLYRWTMRQVRRQAAHVIAISAATADDVTSMLGVPAERVTVSHHGEPVNLEPPTEEATATTLRQLALERGSYVLFLGELSHRKNPLGLLDAFARLPPRCAGLRLVFAGSPSTAAAAARERVAELGLGSRVDFLGHVPRESVAALLAGAASVAFPSQDEGFGIPAVEAMAAGAPLVVSDRGALPEVVGDGALVVEYGDVDGLASALTAASTDEEVRGRLVAAGRRRAAEFSWKRAATTTHRVYRQVLRSR